MCDLCRFLEDNVLGQLETSLVVIQMVPQKGWRQRKLSIQVLSLLERYNSMKDRITDAIDKDYETSLARFKREPSARNEVFFKELQYARSQLILKLNAVKKLVSNAEPWLTVMEA